jgi:4-hydroxybenzoate polyprenyltransferase
MFDPVVIEGINPSLLVLLPFLIVALVYAIRESFKAAGKEVPAVAVQALALVLSFGAVAGSYALSGMALPVSAEAWLKLAGSFFSLQMVAYEIIVKRVIDAFGK